MNKKGLDTDTITVGDIIFVGILFAIVVGLFILPLRPLHAKNICEYYNYTQPTDKNIDQIECNGVVLNGSFTVERICINVCKEYNKWNNCVDTKLKRDCKFNYYKDQAFIFSKQVKR